MAGRHVALLVEDDPDMAAEARDLLDSLGFGCIHATNKEDALRLAIKGGFCFVLLDLQIKAKPDSIKAHVEAGQGLLDALRELYPRRNERDKHCLQIIVLSGHAKELEYVVRVLQDKANDFIAKPVTESKRPLKDVIDEALRRSGCDNHERCASIMHEARKPLTVARALTITGRMDGQRMVVRAGEQPLLLTPGSFIILLHLALGRVRDGEGWVHKLDLGARTEQGWQGISRLKSEVREAWRDFVANDSKGKYRVRPEIAIEFDLSSLESHPEARVAKLAREIRRIQEATTSKGPGPTRTRSTADQRPAESSSGPDQTPSGPDATAATPPPKRRTTSRA